MLLPVDAYLNGAEDGAKGARFRLDGVAVRCPECSHVGHVIGCASFACAACGRIARTIECEAR